MLLPCSYAFVYTLHFLENMLKHLSDCIILKVVLKIVLGARSAHPTCMITISSILLIILLANSGETLEIAC